LPNIIFEDNHIIVVVKPQNMPSQGDISGDTDLLSEIKQYLKQKYNKPGNVFLGLVHRLDRPTGGVMVFAKTSKAAGRLSEQLKSGEFEKTYYAVLSGVLKNKFERLSNFLKKDEKENIVHLAPSLEQGSRLAELDYTVVAVKEILNKQTLTLVKVNLLTGRSHQIRVQFAAAGASVYGDTKYANSAEELSFNTEINREIRQGIKSSINKKTVPATTHLALWAYNLKFNHPVTKERLSFVCLPPMNEVPWNNFDESMFTF